MTNYLNILINFKAYLRLSPAEKNYDVGNCELLAVKLALEEWQHWLEGTETPFLIRTDHKNLTYLRDAKKFTARQAPWSLFFNHFNFILTFQAWSQKKQIPSLANSLPQMYQTLRR